VDKYGGTAQPQPNCVTCGGFGYAWPDEITKEHIALVSNVGASEQRTQTGSNVSDTLNLSFRGEVIVSTDDLVRIPDVVVPIPFIRKYDAAVGGLPLAFKAEDIETLTTKLPRPEDPIIVLIRGKDFTLHPGGRFIYFPEGSRVTHGMTVSGEAMAVPQYLIETVPSISRHMYSDLSSNPSVIQLPKFATAVRADILIGQRMREAVNDVGELE
jgi:hypothetical protein